VNGPIARAMLGAWRAPACTRDVALRVQVSMADAHRTASRLVQRGDLRVVASGRPALLQAAACDAPQPQQQVAAPARAARPVPSVFDLAWAFDDDAAPGLLEAPRCGDPAAPAPAQASADAQP